MTKTHTLIAVANKVLISSVFCSCLFAAPVTFSGEVTLANANGPGCQRLDEHDVCLTLLFSGEIRPGDTAKFLDAVQRANGAVEKATQLKSRIGEVIFDSQGGDLLEAMKLGKAIREGIMWTGVSRDAECYSACVVALLGGVFRIPVGPTGIHSFYSPETFGPADFPEASKRYDLISEEVEQYLKQMRVPVALLDEMKKTPHYNLRVLNVDELERLGVLGIDPVYAQIYKPNAAP